MASLVAECLALRAWTLRALAGRTPFGDPPVSSPSTWAHFLAVERCALPLNDKLAAAGHHSLPHTAKAPLERATHAELQRVLAARAEIDRVDGIAAQREWDVVVLKGAVTVLGTPHRALDLADVDLLAASDDARALVDALESGGDRIAGPSSPLHLAARATQDALPIEVHTRLEIWDRELSESFRTHSVPVPGMKRLRRLAPRDHLLHLLAHVGVSHAYRRGAIRDMVLLEHAVRECSAKELEDIQAVVARNRRAAELLPLLDMARDLAAQRGTVVDTFQYQSGTVYAVSWHGRRLPLPRVLKADIGRWAIALLNKKGDMETEWAKVTMRTLGTSFAGPIARVERTVPRLGRVVRVVSRAIRALAAIVIAVPLAMLARYQARRAVRALG